jgi:hypothetical protein
LDGPGRDRTYDLGIKSRCQRRSGRGLGGDRADSPACRWASAPCCAVIPFLCGVRIGGYFGLVGVLALLDRLERLVETGRRLPGVGQVRVGRAEIEELLADLRASVGVEGRDARWLVQHRYEVLAEAARECDRLLMDVREKAALEQRQIVPLAERRADAVLAAARKQAFELAYEVEQWAEATFGNLDHNLTKFVGAVRNGRRRFHERSSKESALADEQSTNADTQSREAA